MQSLHLGSLNHILKYQMETEMLGNTRIEKDLGVFIDEELNFHAHVSKAEEKASRLLGLIRATCTCLNTVTILRLFTTIWYDHT